MEKVMYIYKLTQDINSGWDTYDSAIVVAKTPDEAKSLTLKDVTKGGLLRTFGKSWAEEPEDIVCNLVGVTNLYEKPQIILSSFNAG